MTILKDSNPTPWSIAPNVTLPPSDLYSDEPPLETYLHLQQMLLLMTCLGWLWRERENYFAAGNLSIYYSPGKIKSKDFRGPDFFVVLGTERRPRKSWVVWEEDGKYPNLIIEILSDSTAAVDRGCKKEIYQDIFRTPDYFWFDPDSEEFEGFHLVDGKYEPLEPNGSGWLWSEQLQLFLGIREGQLRYFMPSGELVPTPEEEAQRLQVEAVREREEALRSRQEADQEREKTKRLAERLRSLGVDPDNL
ncbi:MAG: Uma2 family endonuclease [Cyanobacteria bacterium J06641_5]